MKAVPAFPCSPLIQDSLLLVFKLGQNSRPETKHKNDTIGQSQVLIVGQVIRHGHITASAAPPATGASLRSRRLDFGLPPVFPQVIGEVEEGPGYGALVGFGVFRSFLEFFYSL